MGSRGATFQNPDDRFIDVIRGSRWLTLQKAAVIIGGAGRRDDLRTILAWF